MYDNGVQKENGSYWMFSVRCYYFEAQSGAVTTRSKLVKLLTIDNL